MNKHDQQLSALYKSQALEQPSPEIDEKILTQAKVESKNNKKPRVKLYNYVPYSVAASMAIAGLLFFSFPEFYQLKQPIVIPEFEPRSLPAPMKSQPAALSSPQPEVANQPEPKNLGSQAKQAQKPATIELMADEMIQQSETTNTLNASEKKERMSADTLISITELSPVQIHSLERLLKDNKKQQAIKLLIQLKQLNPQLILPKKYQKLLAQANEQQ